jgi:hypothetical protein
VSNPWPPGSAAVNTFSGYGCRPEVALPDSLDLAPPGFVMPRLRDFKDRAIFADLNNSPPRLASRHADGINVLYGHGGARWVPRKAFADPLDRITGNTGFNTEMTEIWDALDKQ